ncbi:large-conductance mechanosensitive channel [Chytriomyces cf. hyalinus JEL632]|nr:large-conductance mechanosensitive channel [Chytriomyces cf. hyalinus JEL632]
MSSRKQHDIELAESRPTTAASSHNRIKEMTNNMGSSIGDGIKKTGKATMGVGEAFMAFINRGSVVDLAIGIVVGGAFTAIVNSFVADLITPVIGLATQKNLNNLFIVIHCSANSTTCRKGTDHPYATILQATTDGAATWNYGNFIQYVINFIIIALAMFLLVQAYSSTLLKAMKKPTPPKTKPCQMCFEECNIQALKCKWCLTMFANANASESPLPDGNFYKQGSFSNKQ